MEQYVFYPVAFLALASGMAVIFTLNPVHSALFLVLNFFALAVLYVLLDAHFLAAVQVIVYAGAIMVLFLFVIMMLSVDRDESPQDALRSQRPLAYALGIGLGGLTMLVLRSAYSTVAFRGLKEANASGNVQGIGRGLFTKYLFPFEVTSVLLIVAAIAVVVLARRRSIGEDEGRAAEAPAGEPAAGEAR